MANTVKIGISASDEGFKSTMQNAAKSAAELGNAMTGAGGKSKTLNGQLREARKSAQELTMQWRALDDNMKNSDFGRNLQSQLQQVLDKAGELQDIKGDVANEIKNIASDTKMWDGAAQGIGILSSSIQGLASVVGLCGGNTEAFTKALTAMKGVEAATNTVIQIGNALQKDSALMVMLRAMRTKLLAAAQTQATTATVAQTAATEAQTAAQAANNAVMMANPYIAIAAAVVALGVAIWGAVKAINSESDALDENSKKVDSNKLLKEKLKKSEEDWSQAVYDGVNSQLSKYTELQAKWLACNKDQKLREKFQREYGEEVNRVAGKVKKLSEYENFFVRDTDKVVDAILARAAAEAGAAEYAKALIQKKKNDEYGTVANGRYRPVAHVGDEIGKGYLTKEAMSAAGITGADLDFGFHTPGLGKTGVEKMNKYWTESAQAILKAEQDHVDYWAKATRDLELEKQRKLSAAGMSEHYNPPKAYGGGGGHHGSSGSSKHGSSGSSKHGSSGSSSGKKPEKPEEPKPVAQSLQWLRDELAKLQHDLEYGLIPADKIEETKAKIDYLKKDIENKEIELGFREPKAVIGSIDYLKEQISKLQSDLSKGLIPEEDVEKTKEQIEKMTDAITEQEIIIGIKPAPQTAFEAFELAHKYKNDWKDLDKFVSDYNAKWDEYAASMKKYEDDLKAYNDAWDEYNRKTKEYNENLKKYENQLKANTQASKKQAEEWKKNNPEQFKINQLTTEIAELENQKDKLHDEWVDDAITDEAYDKENARLDKLIDKKNAEIKKQQELLKQRRASLGIITDEAELHRQLNEVIAQQTELTEKRDREELSKADFEKLMKPLDEKFEMLQQLMHGETLLDNVEVSGSLTKPVLPVEPKLEMPKKPFAPGQEIDLKAIFGDSLDRIPAHVEQLMQMVNKRIAENASDGERVLGEQILNKLQEYLDEITLGKITIKANVVPTFSTEFGSDADLRASYENAQQNFQQIMSDFDMGIISTSDEAIEKLKEINKQLTDMGLKPIIIDIKPGWQQDLDNAANSLNQIGNIMGQIGEEADSKQLDAAKLIAQAIANIWLGYSEASVAAADQLGPWAWAGFSIGALGQVIGIISAMNKYESGGIVGGSTTMGDRIVARLNAGEMVLNKRQQSNLFRALDHGIDGGSSAAGPTTVRIKGEDLYLSMHNHYKRTKKSPFK